jgi:ribosome biogenesis GTPase
VSDGPVQGVVLSGTGGRWQVRTDAGDTVECVLRGRLKVSAREARDARGDHAPAALKLAVGDIVHLDSTAGDWAISEILPRRSKLARRAPGGAYGERVIAANVDQVVIVFAAAKPEPHVRMLDRFLVIAESNALASRIVVNKVDLVDERDARLLFGEYERIGYPVHYVSVKRGDGLEGFRDALADRVSVFTGPSGVGKSSMLNALFPGLSLRVGEISESVNKGRHTTVGAVMIPLPGGGYVVDTPGLREVGISELLADRLDHCFVEFRGLAEQCRFGDCQHVVEPDCAIREALGAGRIKRDRYDSYLSLREELTQQS